METHDLPAPPPAIGMQHVGIRFRFGKRTEMKADVTITNGGILSIGALVSSVLLSTAVVVRAARGGRAERRKDLRKRDRDALRRI